MRVRGVRARPLRVPLREPFAIATATLRTTLSVELEVELVAPDGRVARGLGEAATLPPVTRERDDDVLARVAATAATLAGLAEISTFAELADVLGEVLPTEPVFRAGLEAACLDAWARLEERPLADSLACHFGVARSALRSSVRTDITLPIASPERMGELAADWTAAGFTELKIKVGRVLDDDVRALESIVRAAPRAALRLDANAAMSAWDALVLLEQVRRMGGHVALFEQPCAKDDEMGNARVASEGGVPVFADESLQGLDDLPRLAALGFAGINLKLTKHGGMLPTLAIAHRAKELGLELMAGAMVETRLGLTAMLQVVSVAGIEIVDLDTALLLTGDPYEGGYDATRLPVLRRIEDVGLGITRRS